MNNEEMVTGDDMIALLIADGGDEGATFAPGDRSREALIARNGHLFARIVSPTRSACIDYYEMAFDGYELEKLGYVTYAGIGATLTPNWYLTDLGISLATSLRVQAS